ncbi:uncharacterized protein LOC100692023 isoform X2 [Oreochromis niloticus]|uniref:uncharacterized protein LOC100692023 isoform X2 n=1 Tax=Oreochromis niloticus TaxID=8128 RepID=UPI00022B2E1B|nr:uncharacterized protein LOC100692023 isoform X2 [Oreochromis niloticus]CAI5686856.1 unnamed protein product [Mustela putorius furo]
MKTLSAALVLLSLISVGQPASLACEKLLKPSLNQCPDLSGRWHVIAASMFTLTSTSVSASFSRSGWMDVISKCAPNRYAGTAYVKENGVCMNQTATLFYANGGLFEVNSENAISAQQAVLLQTGCPDCLVIKGVFDILLFFSRRTAVSATELTEFETQAECLGKSKPELFSTDHVCGI